MGNETTETRYSGMRWGRALIAALVAEILLVIIAVGMRNLLPGESGWAIRWAVLLLGTLLLFAAAGYWTAKPALRAHILHGIVVGVIGTVLYVLFRVVLSVRGVADFDGTFSLPNLFDHALKIIAGGAGGYLALRRAVV